MRQEDKFNQDLHLVVEAFIQRKGIARIMGAVKIAKVNLLIDVYAWLAMTTESGIDFNHVDELDPEEYLTWLVYAANKSYQTATRSRSRMSIQQAEEITAGIPERDRKRIFKLIVQSRSVGQTVSGYQEALRGDPEEDDTEDSAEGQDQKKSENSALRSS